MTLAYVTAQNTIAGNIGAIVGAGDVLFITASGGYFSSAATASDDYGVSVVFGGSLQNAGTISSNYGAVVVAQANTGRVSNIGNLHGATHGILIDTSAGGAIIANRGTIFGGLAGIRSQSVNETFIENSGQIIGQAAIWQMSGTATKMTVVNSGALISTGTYAVVVNGTTSTSLNNSGLVAGAVEMRAGGTSTLLNSGMVQGDVFLLRLAGSTQGSAVYRASGDGTVLGSVTGDAGADILSGALARDQFVGGAGNDTLRGYGGSDSLNGGDGADQLRGGADDDLLQGGVGADRIWGGADDDTFIYTATNESSRAFGTDTITDFNRAEDVIDLSALAGTGRYIGTRKFKADGSFQVREMWNKQSKIGTLLVDTNGDRVVDMSIILSGQTGLITNDNLLL